MNFYDEKFAFIKRGLRFRAQEFQKTIHELRYNFRVVMELESYDPLKSSRRIRYDIGEIAIKRKKDNSQLLCFGQDFWIRRADRQDIL